MKIPRRSFLKLSALVLALPAVRFNLPEVPAHDDLQFTFPLHFPHSFSASSPCEQIYIYLPLIYQE